jgi:ubiquitin-protein ligase
MEKVCPFHFVLEFKDSYPQSAPSAGFPVEFPYHDGASYTCSEGPLRGMQSICLDILGNFGHVHTEWKNQKGTGWSAAMNVTTLLINLQSVLFDLDKKLSKHEKNHLFNNCINYRCDVDDDKHTGECPYPPIAIPIPILEHEHTNVKVAALDNVKEENVANVNASVNTIGDKLMADALNFAQATRLRETEISELVKLLNRAALEATKGEGEGEGEGSTEENKEEEKEAPLDESIICYMTLANYQEDTLGFGVSIHRSMFKTAAELLSITAFEGGLRQSSYKEPFSHFLPAWINPNHACKSHNWVTLMDSSLFALAEGPHRCKSDMIFSVLPNLINSMSVEIMKEQKAGAIKFFEALCSFWRTLRWYIETDEAIKIAARKKINDFISSENGRHKDVCPDIGQLLALSTCLAPPNESARKVFIDAYLDESNIRCVMWWQRNGATTAQQVFEETRVGRDLCLFQLHIVKYVLGGDRNGLEGALRAIDTSNGKPTERLETLLESWKGYKADPPQSWAEYANRTGCSPRMAAHIGLETDAWIRSNVERSNSRGPRYQFVESGGRGRGRGGGKCGRGGGGVRGRDGGGPRFWRDDR